MTVVILCGGSGTRLWPLSRKSFPKQFCDLLGDGTSLFTRTVRRNAPLADRFIIVTNKLHEGIAREQFSAVAPDKVPALFILEADGRNTAPAIAFAALASAPGETLLVVPSDHLIRDEEAYARALSVAVEASEAGYLCTFGLKPEYPETGYGYIEAGEALAPSGYRLAKAFKEKPDKATAEAYIASGRYSWNSGMFAFKAGRYLEELKALAPEIYGSARKAFETAARRTEAGTSLVELGAMASAAIPSQSIDYAVMEGCMRKAVVPCSLGWSDLGSWDAVYEARKARVEDSTNTLEIESRGNLVVGDGRKVVLVGMEDCIVVDTKDALLVMKRGKGQGIKEAVERLAKLR